MAQDTSAAGSKRLAALVNELQSRGKYTFTREDVEADQLSGARRGCCPAAEQAATACEALSGARQGQYSIRINDQYRICFAWNDSAEEIEVVDYH